MLPLIIDEDFGRQMKEVSKIFRGGNYCSHISSRNKSLDIEKVIFNNPATIVFFKDGTKIVTKTHNEEFDKEKGVAMAVMRKIYSRNEFTKIVENGIEQVVEADEDYEFKVGDKVRVVGTIGADAYSTDQKNKEIGEVFTIRATDATKNWPYELKGTNWLRNKEELELVEKAEEED